MSVTTNVSEAIRVLDHGYVRFVEAWGHGDAGESELDHHPPHDYFITKPDFECGIVEAARQSTQGSFRGWEDRPCPSCKGVHTREVDQTSGGTHTFRCPVCLESPGIERGDQRLLAFLFNGKPQHATPFEFSGMTIEVQAPIFVYREWHRHRTQSYNEMSARYAPLPNINYAPEWEVLKERGEKAESMRSRQQQGAHPWNEVTAQGWWRRLPDVYTYLEKVYNDALLAGVPKEIARIVLPVGRYSRMRASGNLRNWLAFCTLRSDSNAQWEIRQFSLAVEQILSKVFPRTYDLFLKRRGA